MWVWGSDQGNSHPGHLCGCQQVLEHLLAGFRWLLVRFRTLAAVISQHMSFICLSLVLLIAWQGTSLGILGVTSHYSCQILFFKWVSKSSLSSGERFWKAGSKRFGHCRPCQRLPTILSFACKALLAQNLFTHTGERNTNYVHRSSVQSSDSRELELIYQLPPLPAFPNTLRTGISTVKCQWEKWICAVFSDIFIVEFVNKNTIVFFPSPIVSLICCICILS